MSAKHPKDLILEANEAVASASCNPKKLALIHTGIAAGANFVVALLTYLLGSGIGNPEGLTGMNLQVALETAQAILQVAVAMAGPFWAMGFVAAILPMARRQHTDCRNLLQGFRHWGAVLRTLLLQGVMYFAVILACGQIGSLLYTLTPFSAQLTELITQMSISGDMDTAALTAMLMELDQATLMRIFWSMLPFLALPVLIAVVILSYRLRLSQYILMDKPQMGALFATFGSIRLTKKNCLRLLKLDLRFWWFYALETLIAVVCYGDLILPMLGVDLGMNEMLASFLFYALGLALQIGLYAWQKPQIIASYGLFYDDLLPKENEDQTQVEL